jgi:SAM-dependent methyltransferase
MSQPKGYVDADYLDTAARLMAPVKRRSFELLWLRPGDRVLDLGCGPGTDTLTLGEIVGADGEVHGVDHDPDMVARANERAAAAGLAGRVSHRRADAAALPWPDAFFDASRCERVFQHLADPARAFAELVRVTRPGGGVVVLDGDWGAFTIDCDEDALERRLARFHAERMIHNPYSGRRLARMFRLAGFEDLTVEVWPVLHTDYGLARRMLRLDRIAAEALAEGAIDRDELGRWEASLARAAASGGFFACLNAVMVAGRKPGA